MKTMTVNTQIEQDGTIRLAVPSNLPSGPAEVVLVIQPKAASGGPPYDTLEGILAGRVANDFDVEAALREMNREWEESMEFLQ